MRKNLLFVWMVLMLAIATCFNAQAQTWTAPTLPGSTLVSGTTYYVYNVGSNGYLTAGGWWGTQSNVSAQPRANASISVVKYTATNTSGSLWTFQYNLDGSDVANWFLCPTNSSSSDGSVETNDYDWSGRLPNRPWNVVQTDATKNIYSIQVPSTYAGYVASQYLGSAATTEDTNGGTCNVVRYNRASGDSYTQWKFVSQADMDLYNARVVLDKYMNYAKTKGGIDISTYITTYDAGVTADINTAAANLLTALGRTDVTSSITNPSFETNDFTGWTNNSFTIQSNDPGQGWTKEGTYYIEKYTDKSNWNLTSGTLTQTVTGLSNGLYELVVSGHAVQQNGGNPLHTGAFIKAGSQSAEVVAGQDYSISNITVTDGTLTIGYSLIDPVKCNWTGFDNFRLYYYGAIVVPTITSNVTGLNLEKLSLKDSVTISGLNLTSDITITAPAGITVNPTSISKTNAVGIKVYVTYDGVTTVNDSIVFASGALVKKVGVKAVNVSCFTPLYASGNLIADPLLNSLTAFGGWGTRTVNTDPAYVYCGSSSGKISGGDIEFNGLNINTKYRVKAKVFAVTGEPHVGVYHWDGAAADINHAITTLGSWQDVDFTFTTGATVGANNSNGVFFNNSSEAYIDNWEIYEIPYTAVSSSSLTFAGASTKKVAVTAQKLTSDITITAPTGFSVTPSTLLATVAGDSVAITYDGVATASGYVYFTSGTIKDSVLVAGTANPALYTIDFAGETTSGVVPTTDEYSVNADMSSATDGTGVIVSLTPGQNLYYRTKATGVYPASVTQTLTVPARPSTPAYTVDFINEKTTQVVPATDEYATNADMSSATSGTGAKVTVTPAQNLYFMVKATASAFKSAVQTLTVAARPVAPTSPVSDDNANTFDWTNNASFNSVAAYEFSTNSGSTWTTASAKPVNVGNVDLAIGTVQVRIKAATDHFCSLPLSSTDKYTLSTGISVASSDAFIIYPNPVKDVITIKGLTTPTEVSIVSVSGKLVFATTLTVNTINVENLPNGIYFIKLSNKEGTTVSKFIKE